MLWAEAMGKGYNAPLWMTFKQSQELGGHVRKGEHGSLVVYANTLTKAEPNAATGEGEKHKIPFMKGYWTSGTTKLAAPLEACWSDAGSGEGDRLHLYGVQWLDGLPDDLAFDRLMQEAVKVIDAWIASRV
jgi:hypothetical protein